MTGTTNKKKTTTTEIAPNSVNTPNTMDVAELEKMNTLAKETNPDVSAPKIPVLKINYTELGDRDPKGRKRKKPYELGDWVVGQRKNKDGEIEEEGQKAIGVIIYAVKNRYSLYHPSDKNKSCSSPYHNTFGTVKGNNYGYVCGKKTCPHTDPDLKYRCRAQKVIFGTALVKTEDGKIDKVDCVAYIQGSGYMELVEFLEESTIKKVGGKYYEVPTFSFLTNLGSMYKKNGEIEYYVPVFSIGKQFDFETTSKLTEKFQDVENLVDKLNKMNNAAFDTVEEEADTTYSEDYETYKNEAQPKFTDEIEEEQSDDVIEANVEDDDIMSVIDSVKKSIADNDDNDNDDNNDNEMDEDDVPF